MLTAGKNPTESVTIAFPNYVQAKTSQFSAHLINGVPDYAFALDLKLRSQLNSMGPVRHIAKSLVSAIVPIIKAQMIMRHVAVGPNQYPEIYEMAEDCARTLGIGVPQVFIQQTHEFNAFAYATDDNSSVVALTSHLVEHMSPTELKFIIGHECGHLHNLHSMYNFCVNLLLNKGLYNLVMSTVGGSLVPLNLLSGLMKFGIQALMSSWSRCAEITCDRAGVICCGDIKAGQSALSKISSGMDSVNPEEMRRQLTTIKQSVLRFQEWQHSHPLVPKRVEALHLFAQCETLYGWKPEMRGTKTALSKEEIDRRCAQLISLTDTQYKIDEN